MAEIDDLLARPGPGPHRGPIAVAGADLETLIDLPPNRAGLLFVGLNPSPVSVTAGHYHQGRLGRAFWRRLMIAGVLPAGTPVATADDALVAAGHGITDLIKLPTARDVATDRELTLGVGPLWQKVAVWRPSAIVNSRTSGANTRQIASFTRKAEKTPEIARPLCPRRGGERGLEPPAQPPPDDPGLA